MLGSFDKINCTKKLFLVNFSLYCQKHIKECLIATHYLSFLKRDLSQTNHWRIFSSLFCKKRANYDEWQNLCSFRYLPANIRLEDVFSLRLQKTSWSRRICSPYSCVYRRHLQDVFIKINIFVLVIRLQDVFKIFWKRLQDVFKTFSRRIIKLNCYAFETYSKRFWYVLLRRLSTGGLPGHSSEKFMVSVQNSQEW